MIIKTSRRKYNLSKDTDLMLLKKNIKQMDAARKRAVFDQVKEYKDYKGSNKIYNTAREICRLATPENMTSKTLSPQKIDVSNDNNASQNLINKTKSNIQKTLHESGEENFQAFYAHLLMDMSNYNSNLYDITLFAAIVLNMYMHIATLVPSDDQAIAQKREYDTKWKLRYYRSNGYHPVVQLISALLGFVKQSCRLPFNNKFVNLLTDLSQKLSNELKQFNLWGIPKKSKKVDSYVGTRIGHAGARQNNLTVLQYALWDITETETNENKSVKKKVRSLGKTLEMVLPCTKKKIQKLTPEEAIARTKDLRERFSELLYPKKAVLNLGRRLLAYRTERVNHIIDNVKKSPFKNMTLINQHTDITCLLIRLYPDCYTKTAEYKVGVTNFILSFLGGLINFHLAKEGQSLYVDRRQSFGFLRPTMTDAGNLVIRLSLGVETSKFDTIVLQSLYELDSLLGKYIFSNPKHKSVAKYFQKPEGYKRSSYIKKSVSSDSGLYKTFHQATAYIAQAEKTSERNYLKKAMSSFLENYVVNGQCLDLDNLQKTEEGITVCDSVVAQLLSNTLKYAIKHIKNSTFLDVLEDMPDYAHSGCHALSQLHTHCNTAGDLLRNINNYEGSRFSAEAARAVEYILEDLIVLDTLDLISQGVDDQNQEPIDCLKDIEKTQIKRFIDVNIRDISIFFSDSGQQAITTSLLLMSQLFHGYANDGKTYDHDVYLYNDSYFEIGDFMKDSDHALETKVISKAKIVFIDISRLKALKINECNNMQALVIDATHHPVLDSPVLKAKMDAVRNSGGWVVIVKSYAKHGQLGLDKYQVGNIAVIEPENDSLPDDIQNLFDEISAAAIPPAIASYFNMLHKICHEANSVDKDETAEQIRTAVSAQALAQSNLSLLQSPKTAATKRTKVGTVTKTNGKSEIKLGI